MVRYFFVISILLTLVFNKVYSTAQIPDILWYNGEKYSLFSNPLESYFNEDNPRPDFIIQSDCWCTACWRGYQATWKIIDDQLYLIKIGSCCFTELYMITDEVLEYLHKKDVPTDILTKLETLKDKEFTDYNISEKLEWTIGKANTKKYGKLIQKNSEVEQNKSADLRQLFGEHFENGMVKAFWFSGDLKIPQGKMLEYVHMGYSSTYERELVFEIEGGDLVAVMEYENKPSRMPKNFKVLAATSYSVYVPADLLNVDEEYWYSFADTLELFNSDSSKFISALSAFHQNRKNRDDRFLFVESMVSEFVNSEQSSGLKFKDIHVMKTRWGTCGWVDGKLDKANIRFFVMSNINGYMTILYKEKDDPYQFRYHAETICESVRLMEFSF